VSDAVAAAGVTDALGAGEADAAAVSVAIEAGEPDADADADAADDGVVSVVTVVVLELSPPPHDANAAAAKVKTVIVAIARNNANSNESYRPEPACGNLAPAPAATFTCVAAGDQDHSSPVAHRHNTTLLRRQGQLLYVCNPMSANLSSIAPETEVRRRTPVDVPGQGAYFFVTDGITPTPAIGT
jgi:hypothetical protein